MEKTVVIDGREVVFKSTGGTPIRFKQQFGKDFFAEIIKLQSLADLKKKNVDTSKIDFEGLYNVCWTFAKTADKTIPTPLEWLDTFDEFPLLDILPEITDLLLANLQSKKN